MNIFLSTSFSTKVRPDGHVEANYRSQVEAIIAELESRGDKVFCSLREDNWKLNSLNPAGAFIYDVKSLDKTDLMVVLIRNNPASAGMQFELGYAYARKIKILILCKDDDTPAPYMNLGLLEQPNVQNILYGSLNDLLKKLRMAME